MGQAKSVPPAYIVGFAALTAACAAVFAFTFLGVRMMHVTVATFGLTAVVAWAALLLVVGAAWLVARSAHDHREEDRPPARR